MSTTENKWRDIGQRGNRKWTVMVYMAAENTTELDATAIADLREMEQGATDDAHVVVQINRAWPSVPQRYEITRDKSELVDVAENKNMGREATLTAFLTWAADRFPANNYCLVLWGHAYGLGFGRDHNDALTLKDLTVALKNFKDKRPGNRKLDLLGANACAMSYVEAAYELRESASYMVASQIAVPFAGWPYKTILSRIDNATDTEVLGRLIVDAYVTHFNALLSGQRVAMSLLNLEAANELPVLLCKLTSEIKAEISPQGKFSSIKLDYVRDTFMSTAAGEVRPLIDIRDLCTGFRDADSGPLAEMEDEVKARLDQLVTYSSGHPDLSDLNGIGIFAPFITDEHDLERLGLQDTPSADDEDDAEAKNKKTGREEYQDLAISRSVPEWPRLVYDELRREIPSEIMCALTAIGAPKREDRRDIARIVLSIEGSFNKLDRIIANARKCVKDDLENAAKGAPKPRGRDAVAQETEKRFGQPWLKLIQPPDIATRVAFLKNLLQLQALEQAAAGEGRPAAALAFAGGSYSERDLEGMSVHLRPIKALPDEVKVVNSVIDFFTQVEKAVGYAERATRKGLTNAKFGLGPTAPNQFSIGFRDTRVRRDQVLAEDPKSAEEMGAPDGQSDDGGMVRGDLRVDLAFARVADLFGQVGAALKRLEEATLGVEVVARNMLQDARTQNLSRDVLLRAARDEIDRSFGVLEEASLNARRAVRRVLSHPVYGVGPTSGDVGLEQRQVLATAGGLDRRNLRLL
jgi:hypothetical protein